MACYRDSFTFSFIDWAINSLPVALAELSEVWTVFDRSEAVIADSNPALGMDV
jgi:hypothetical protein